MTPLACAPAAPPCAEAAGAKRKRALRLAPARTQTKRRSARLKGAMFAASRAAGTGREAAGGYRPHDVGVVGDGVEQLGEGVVAGLPGGG